MFNTRAAMRRGIPLLPLWKRSPAHRLVSAQRWMNFRVFKHSAQQITFFHFMTSLALSIVLYSATLKKNLW